MTLWGSFFLRLRGALEEKCMLSKANVLMKSAAGTAADHLHGWEFYYDRKERVYWYKGVSVGWLFFDGLTFCTRYSISCSPWSMNNSIDDYVFECRKYPILFPYNCNLMRGRRRQGWVNEADDASLCCCRSSFIVIAHRHLISFVSRFW